MSMEEKKIVIRGARQHNLKEITVEIPRDKLVVITGVSGSGKSSLAFDTLYAEGQRRYVESLSAYARQFLEQMDKPDVDSIEGLSPAISIEQKAVSKNPRSTVGTVTEIYDYLRLIFARIGVPHCPNCGDPITSMTVQQIADRIIELGEGTRVHILAPVVRGRKGEYRAEFDKWRRDGFVRVRVDGEVHDLSEAITLDKNKKHEIEVFIDRLVVKAAAAQRISDSVELASELADGIIKVEDVTHRATHWFSERFACVHCGFSYPEISPRLFSFNSPYGACPICTGLGTKLSFDPDLIVPDKTLSIEQGAILPWRKRTGVQNIETLEALAKRYGFSLSEPFGSLPDDVRELLFYGTADEEIEVKVRVMGRTQKFHTPFEGVIPQLERRLAEAYSYSAREELLRYMSELDCHACGGTRLRREALNVKIADTNIAQVAQMSIDKCYKFFQKLRLPRKQRQIAKRVLKEILDRLEFLMAVGLDYLTLERASATLAGGEGQRIRLATQIGASLVGVLYILDEPSIGLHARDNQRLLAMLRRLRDQGNTVIVVEHDRETITSADWVIDMGPGAGEHGGEIVAAGKPEDVMNASRSITGQYLAGKREIPIPDVRRKPSGRFLTLYGCAENNLKGIDVPFPLGLITCVTGVSGSGKSTLVVDTLYRVMMQKLHRSRIHAGRVKGISGLEFIDKVIDIDQSPIGRTPRSNPATYTGAFTPIRDLFARLPESKMRGYKVGRFSFNVKGGRCEACSGEGMIRVEMHFLPDVYVTCDQCKGKRFNRETLEIRYKGKNIADVLDMSVEQAYEFYHNVPPIRNKLQTLIDVGMGYIRLGQPATTLSGGEAQRVKLARELSKRSTGKTIYLLDEPTTGLHFEDIKKLLTVLNRLADEGNTVIIIEHNLDVIKTADWIIDLGPEGGDKGGYIVAQGPPEEVAGVRTSYTGRFLAQILGTRAERRAASA